MREVNRSLAPWTIKRQLAAHQGYILHCLFFATAFEVRQLT
jgi:hypothetical protein